MSKEDAELASAIGVGAVVAAAFGIGIGLAIVPKTVRALPNEERAWRRDTAVEPTMAGDSVKDLRIDVRDMERIDDFEALAERIRTHSGEASGSDTERVTMRSFDEVGYEALRELLEALESEDVDPGACVFYLSPNNADRALEGADAEDAEALEDRLGREVRVEESMSDDVVLFMDPDAIDEDGEVVEAHAIACGTVAIDE